METYTATCHCGAVRLRFRSEPITSGVRCNCSICVRKGAIMSKQYILEEHFDEVVGLERLSVYRFGDEVVNHYFCATCGVYPFHDSPVKPGRRVNLGCVHEVDALALPIELIDGRSY